MRKKEKRNEKKPKIKKKNTFSLVILRSKLIKQ